MYVVVVQLPKSLLLSLFLISAPFFLSVGRDPNDRGSRYDCQSALFASVVVDGIKE